MLASGALALALVGCASVGENYRTPASMAPAAWQAAHLDNGAATTSLERWWQQFDDAQLVALIERSFQANPDLLSARASLRASRALERIALAKRSPDLTAGASSGANKIGGNAVAESWVAGFDASWEIDLFGGIRRGVEAAQADRAAAAASLCKRARLAGRRGGAQLHHPANRPGAAADRRAQPGEPAGNPAAHRLARPGRAGQLGGCGTGTHQHGADAGPDPDPADQYRQRRQPPSVLTGEAPGRLQTTLATGDCRTCRLQLRSGSLPMLRQRPDVRAAERTLAAEVARRGVAEAGRYPSFSLSGTLALESAAPATLGNGASVVRSLSAAISGVLFDGGRLEALVEQQDAVREQSLQSYRSTVLGALEDVENALTAFDNTNRRRAALAAASTAARNANLLAADRYRSGLIDFSTVLETERSLLITEDSLASAGRRAPHRPGATL